MMLHNNGNQFQIEKYHNYFIDTFPTLNIFHNILTCKSLIIVKMKTKESSTKMEVSIPGLR